MFLNGFKFGKSGNEIAKGIFNHLKGNHALYQ